MAAITNGVIGVLELIMDILLALPRAALEAATGSTVLELHQGVASTIESLKADMVGAASGTAHQLGEMSLPEMVGAVTSFLKTVLILSVGALRVVVEAVSGAPLEEVLNCATSNVSQWDAADLANNIMQFPGMLVVVVLGVLRAFVEAVTGELAEDVLTSASLAVASFLQDGVPLLVEALAVFLKEFALFMLNGGAALVEALV